MRIAIVIDGLAMGGAERQALNSTLALARSGHEVELIHYRQINGAAAAFDHPALREARITYLARGGGPVGLVRRLSRHLRRGGFEVVHAFKTIPSIYAGLAGRLAGTPVVLGGCRGRYEDRGVVRLAQRLTKSLLAGWIVNSRAIAESLAGSVGVRLEDCYLVRNGVDSSSYRSALASSEAKQRIGLDPSSPAVTIVAGLRPVKNHEMFLRMARDVLDRVPEARFLIVGDGELRSSLESQAQGLNVSRQVRFLGKRGDVADLLAASDVTVLTSHTEGLSNSLLEAMGAGVAVVVTDYPGVRELITDAEQGFIVPRGDHQAMARAVVTLLQDPGLRGRMGRAAALSVEARFSMEAMVSALLDVYGRCLQRAARTSA